MLDHGVGHTTPTNNEQVGDDHDALSACTAEGKEVHARTCSGLTEEKGVQCSPTTEEKGVQCGSQTEERGVQCSLADVYYDSGTDGEDLEELTESDADPDYNPAHDETMSGDEAKDANEEPEKNEPEKEQQAHPVADRKFVVFEANLDMLFTVCQECGAPLKSKTKKICGSSLSIETTCEKGHNRVWHSQPYLGRQPVGNLLMASAILLSGGLYQVFSVFASLMNLAFIGRTTFFDIQKHILWPVIDQVWHDHVGALHVWASTKPNMSLSGDARSDSPGYSAKYTTYSMLDMQTKVLLDFELVHVSETNNNSVAMEKVGLARIMARLDKAGIKVSTIATDRSPQVKNFLKKTFPAVNHQFDVWHFAKSVVKKVHKVAKKKDMETLRQWIPSVSNHLWWSSASCGGNAEMLREKWVSVCHHITNVHTWTGATKFMKCAHGNLEQEDIDWLPAGSAQHLALTKIVTDKKVLEDMGQLTEFRHTGENEVLHNTLLRWVPKRIHFSYEGMRARTQLACLDHNFNTSREQSTTAQGKEKWKMVFPKSKKKWVAKPIYQKKTSAYLHELMVSVYETKEDVTQGKLPECLRLYSGKPFHIPHNIATEEQPDRDEIIQAHQSRMRLAEQPAAH